MHCGEGRVESNEETLLLLTNYIHVSVFDGLEQGGILNCNQMLFAHIEYNV